MASTSGDIHGESPAPLLEFPERHGNDADANQSIVSNLSDDGTQSASVVSRVKANITTIMADSWAIMTAKDVPDDDDDYDDDTGDGDYFHNGNIQHDNKQDTNGNPKMTQNQSKDIVVQSEDEQEQLREPTINFLLDKPKTMTYGRRIALSLAKHTWYNPQLKHQQSIEHNIDDKDINDNSNAVRLVERRPPKVTRKETPSLARAWAYFDRFVLPRFTVREDGSFDRHDLQRAEPGESDIETRLYHPLCTPLSQMGDFGLGIGLYFSTLRALTILTFLAGILNIPNFIYFSGPEYSNSQSGIPDLLKGSAICTLKQWVPCEGCQPTEFDRHRFATAVSVQNETGLFTPLNATFALRNNCAEIALEQGMINYGTLLFIVFGIMVMNVYQKRKEVEFDEDEQTAQDYSIRIMNPPKDAVDPAEWRAFFKDAFHAHATVVTIALDNDPLIRALRERRECLRKIELNLEPGTSLDTLTLAKIAAEVETGRRLFGRLLAYVSKGIPEHFGRMAELEAKIKGWAQLDYPCSSVFVTFETEAEQRRVLSGLALGSYHVKRQTQSKLDAKYLFRGTLVLSIKEPDEPSTIRWADLNVKTMDKLKPLATTTISSLIAIFLIALLVNLIHETSPAWAAIAIAVFNSLFPMIAKMLTSLERHSSEGLKQTSLYFKIALFRWVNTAVVITIITPFTATVEAGNGLIPSIYAIFFADIFTTNAVQLLDPAGHFKRHFLAPRAKTQDAMNLAMQGAEIELAERYTNMTKILFLALWYCSIFPGALFFCSFGLGVIYFVDGFCLMRTWKRLPHLGTSISQFSRRYFFSISLVAMAVVSSYYWTGFPFDNLCQNDNPVSTVYPVGTYNLKRADGRNVTSDVVIDTDTASFRYCLQDYMRYGNLTFPALSRWQPEGGEWMSEDQETVVDVYGWTSLAVIFVVLIFFASIVFSGVRSMFSTGHKHCGDDQGIPFSQVRSISAFVPQVHSAVYSYPLMACQCSGVDTNLFDWTDPDRPHSYYDLTEDADELIGDRSVQDKLVFSILSHVPPPNDATGSNEAVG